MTGEDDKPFRVTDRRGLDEDEAELAETHPSRDGAQEEGTAAQHDAIDFVSFVMSLATSALVHMGEAQDEHADVEPNLPLARQTIDILGMLEAKTKGNLTGDEERILGQLLYDLRLRYVTRVRGG